MKKFKLFLCIICLLTLCCGCWDKRELEDNTFIVLLGIDKADEKDVMVTVAFPPTQLEGGKQGEGGSGEYAIMSVKAPTMVESLNVLGTNLAGPLSLFSVNTIVISQELAETDMLRHIFSSWRYEQTRNTTNVLISKCKAAEFINARVKDPAIDVLRQEELLLEQANESSYYKPVQLLDLIINLKSNGADSVAMYGGLTSKEEEDKSGEEKSDKDIKEPVKKGYLPGEIPLKADNDSQICGLAVFRGNKMVGALDSNEAQIYSMLTQSKTRKILTLADPLAMDRDIVISISPVGNSKIHGIIRNDLPIFDLDVNLHCSLECVQSSVDYTNEGNYEILTAYVREYCLEGMANLIAKIQKEYDADILKLGDKLAYNFPTVEEWNHFNWKEKYKDAQINIHVDLTIDRAGIMMP